MKRIVPLKNYIILIVVMILTIVLTLFLASKYDQKLEDNAPRTLMFSFLSQVTNEELNNYILENPNIIVYVASTKDEKLNKFENEFKEFIINNELTNSIIQIDCDELDKKIINPYLKNIEDINVYPNIIIFKDGKIQSILYNEKTNINITDVKNFIRNAGIVND